MGAGREPHSGMWIVVSVTSAIWTASLPAIVPGAITDRHGIGITAANGGGTVMAMATGTTALIGAPHLVTADTEEIGHQPVILLITAGKPESRTRKSGHSGKSGCPPTTGPAAPRRNLETSTPSPLRLLRRPIRALAATPRGLGSLHSARGLVPGVAGRSALMSGRQLLLDNR